MKRSLEENLESTIKDFTDDIRSKFEEGSGEPATLGDLNELARQTSYALSEFKKHIIEYLKSSSD